MSTPIADAEIATLATDILNTTGVNSITAPSDKIEATMNRWYDIVLEKSLEGFPWNFATDRTTALLNATSPAFGYSDSYKLPKKLLSLNFITEENVPLSQYDYTLEGGNLFIDNSGAESINLGFTQNLKDVSKMAASFKIYLAFSLAHYTGRRLSANTNQLAKIKIEMDTEKANAKAVNGLANPPRAFRKPIALTARRNASTGKSQINTYNI